jgi:hypothetical protein
MKINEKMNSESIKSLKEFRRKQIQSNIKYHIIFLIMIVTINLCLLYFIILFKNKISEIKLKSNQNTSLIKQNEQTISKNQNSIHHKLINIFSIVTNMYGNSHFSLLFEKSEEVTMVKNFIANFTNIINPELILVYQGISDGDDAKVLFNILQYDPNFLMLIGTRDGNKFGYFFGDITIPNNDKSITSKNNNCFIFSFQTKEKFNCLNKGVSLEINKDSLINVGNGDIIINYKYITNGGIINYPFKSFDIPDNYNNTFTKYSGNIEIQDIEIYVIIKE